MIPYGRQAISDDDIEAVVQVLKSDYLTQGPVVPEFESAICDYTSSKYAVAVNSGTSALHIACLALGLEPGDVVWTSPNTFVASANCALYCGATVDFVDIDPDTYNLCTIALEKKLIEAKKLNRLPKIVIPVHFAGQSCDMEAIYQLSIDYGFKIIEDASHAVGGKYKEYFIGGCQYSDITVFSFHPVKIITTAEGGMAVTNSKLLARKMELLRSHGITREQKEMTKEADGAWYYQQLQLGFNYRMTELQGALGKSQLKRIDSFVEQRHHLAERYVSELTELPIVCPLQNEYAYSSYHLFPIQIDFSTIKKTKKMVVDDLRQAGIGVNIHYIPVHRQPYYEQLGFQCGDFPKAERYYERAISIPLFSEMTLSQQDTVVSALKSVIQG